MLEEQPRRQGVASCSALHLCASLIKTTSECLIKEDDKKVLQKHFEEITAVGVSPSEVAVTVQVARFKKAWDKKIMKLSLAVHPSLEPAVASLEKALLSHGGKKCGQAPRGGLAAWRDRSRICLTCCSNPLQWSVRGQGVMSLPIL